MGRVVAIALDAASVPFIDRLVDDGRLPNLARLRAASAQWAIDGGESCLRNLQWMQFNFGRAIDDDRGYLFRFDPTSYRCAMPRAPRLLNGAPQFWDRTDLKSLVFDMPESALVDSAVSITGWGGHAPRFPRASSPPGLIDELDRVLGVHRGFGNDYDTAWHERGAIKALADALVAGAALRARAFGHLRQRFPECDLALVGVSELHSAGHFWMHAADPGNPLYDTADAAFAIEQLGRVYEAVDGTIGAIAAAEPPDTTIVLFSHDDMRPGHADCPSMVLLPELLQRMHDGTGLLRRVDAAAWKAAGCPPVVPRRGTVWLDHVDDQLLDPPARSRLKRHPLYRQAKLTPPGRWLLERLGGRPRGAQGVPIPPESTDDVLAPDHAPAEDTNDLLFTKHYQPHWSRMRAFAMPGFTSSGVRINLVGRERDGLVPLAEYAQVCDEIEAEVLACRNPRTGNPVVRSVHRPRRDDPLDPDGDTVDIVFTWAEELIDSFEHPRHGLIGPVPAHRPGVHERDGFLYVRAAGLAPGVQGTRPASDIPATLLDLAGVEPAEHLEGSSVVRSPVR